MAPKSVVCVGGGGGKAPSAHPSRGPVVCNFVKPH